MSSAADRPYAGIELGGSKCVCTLAFGPGQVLEQYVLPTTPGDETLAAIEAVLAGWWRTSPFAALGIASFGPLDLRDGSAHRGRILATNKPGWEGADVAGRLGRPFGVPVVIDTDVNGAAAAECLWGVGRGCRDFAYVTVGTGVGVGMIANGRPTRGFMGHGEAGHLLVPRLPGDGFPSACRFHENCVEALASAPAVRARAGGVPLEQLPDDAPAWDVVVHALVHLCNALACFIGPERIAIGGGVLAHRANLFARIDEGLRRSLGGYLALPAGGDYVVAPGLGDQAGPLGPIALARNAGATRPGANGPSANGPGANGPGAAGPVGR